VQRVAHILVIGGDAVSDAHCDCLWTASWVVIAVTGGVDTVVPHVKEARTDVGLANARMATN